MIFPFKCPFRVRKKCQAPCLIAEGTHIDIDDPNLVLVILAVNPWGIASDIDG
jgi:hypothetical protein